MCLLGTGSSAGFTCEPTELASLTLLWTKPLVLAPRRPERGFLPTDDDEDETSFSLTPSLSLVLGAGRSLEGILSDASVPRPPSFSSEEEVILKVSSLRPSLPLRRLVVTVTEEGALVLAAGLVILKDVEGVATEEGGLMSDMIVLFLEISNATRAEGLDTPPGRRMVVVVDGFWSSLENTDDRDAWLFSL